MCGSAQSKALSKKKLKEIWQNSEDCFSITYKEDKKSYSKERDIPESYFLHEIYTNFNLPIKKILQFPHLKTIENKSSLSQENLQSTVDTEIHFKSNKYRIYYDVKEIGYYEIEAYYTLKGAGEGTLVGETPTQKINNKKYSGKKLNISNFGGKSSMGDDSVYDSERNKVAFRNQNFKSPSPKNRAIVKEKSDMKITNHKSPEVKIKKLNNMDTNKGKQEKKYPSSYLRYEVKSSNGEKSDDYIYRINPNPKRIYSPEEWVLFLRNHPSPFEDFEFPENDESIYGIAHGSKENGIDERLEFLKLSGKYGYYWDRPSYSEKILHLFPEVVDPFTVTQGLLQTDYFLSALISIGLEKGTKEALNKITLQGLMNVDEVFGFTLNNVGLWAILDIDEALPFFKREMTVMERKRVEKKAVNNSSNQIDKNKYFLKTCFFGSHSSDNTLWVSYIEKAYAKMNGGYFNISHNGRAKDAFTDLTGAPCSVINISEEIKNDQILENYLENLIQTDNFISCKSISWEKASKKFIREFDEFNKTGYNKPETFLRKKFGILPSQNYSFIGLKKFQKSESLFITLRSTFGNSDGYLGGFPPEISKEAITEIYSEVNKTGHLYLPFSTFRQFFSEICVCHYHKGFVYSGLRFNCTPNEFYSVQLNVKKAGFYYIRASQLSHCSYTLRTTRSKVEYPPLTLLLGNFEGAKDQFLGGVKQADRDVWIKSYLPPGIYRIFVIFIFNFNFLDQNYI